MGNNILFKFDTIINILEVDIAISISIDFLVFNFFFINKKLKNHKTHVAVDIFIPPKCHKM